MQKLINKTNDAKDYSAMQEINSYEIANHAMSPENKEMQYIAQEISRYNGFFFLRALTIIVQIPLACRTR